MTKGTPRAVCWLREDQTDLIARVLAASGIAPVGAGCPEPAHTGQVAQALGCDPCSDLRSALTGAEADLILIAAPGDFAHEDVSPDLTALQMAKSRGVPVATLEPIPASAMTLSGTKWVEALDSGALAELIRFAPRTRRTRAIDELHALLETFGVPRSGAIRMHGPATMGSLGARLFDAMDLTRTLFGVPETVDACCVTPATGRAVHRAPGENLRALEGDLTAHLRFPDGRSLTLMLSDRPPTGAFDARLIGTEGVIDVSHARLDWQHPSGSLDSTELHTDESDPSEAALIAQLQNLCAGVGPKHAPIDYPAVLSMTHAALLSCRTGQGESPDTIRRLMLSA